MKDMISEIKNPYLKHRYLSSLRFIQKNIEPGSRILDIGTINQFSKIMQANGFDVENTMGQDFDIDYLIRIDGQVDVITALEVLEHLVSPFPLLKNLPGKKLIATVPLRLWFASAYRNPNDEWDCHFHEFEDWQFDWLLKKSGWKIIDREKWNSPIRNIGIRPILRTITPRYYAVYAERF